MEDISLKEKIERWKGLADSLLAEDKRVYIKDTDDSIYFADIIFIGENTIEIQCFSPKKKKDKKFVLFWYNLTEFKEYKVKK